MIRALSADHARRFLVRRHLLDPPRRLPARPASVLDVVRRLGSLQFDPLEYTGARSHDLVLHARIRGYRRAWCDGWLYGPPHERRLFEAYNKALNILPLDELPFYRIAWERAAARHAGGIFTERAAAVRAVLDRLRDEGPLSTAAFANTGPAVAWHWAPTAESRAALEGLFEAGQVGIARRDGSRRTFDLIDRLFPADLLARRTSVADAHRHRLLSRFRGVGLMGAVGSAELVGATVPAAERTRIVDDLVESGVLLPVQVEDVRGLRYLLAEELPLLQATTSPPRAPRPRGVTFLAPLDPLIWDRKLVRSLFGLDYKWEVYVPEAKRRHGYYVLPILFGDRLIGRIEPRFERRTGTLHVVGVSLEPGAPTPDDPEFVAALGEALESLRAFVGADRLTFPKTRLGRAIAAGFRAAAMTADQKV